MKKFGVVLLALVCFLTACGGAVTSDTPDTPETDATPVVQPLSLVTERTTDYTIVYDDSSESLTAIITDFITEMNRKLKTEFVSVGASKAEADYGHEIVIGNVRASAQPVAENMNTHSDFAMGISGDDWVLCATSDSMYSYLFMLVKNRIFPNVKGGTLTVKPEDDLIYHSSFFADKSFADQCLVQSGKLSHEAICEITEKKTFTAADGTKLLYRFYMPSDYDPTKTYPVILFLHGAGDRGDDNTKQLSNMITTLFNLENSPIIDTIMIIPQCPTDSQWVNTPWRNGNYSVDAVPESKQLAALMQVLDEVQNTYSTDKNRVYAMGVSMGGFGTWDLIMRHPDRFAAALPMCGGADPAKAEVIKDMPIYTFHGSEDATVPVNATRSMVTALEVAGSTSIRYEELAGEGHNIQIGILSRIEVINWLLRQTKQ